ncbi:hypothetical protein phiK7A1_057 [Pseudomonas phage phiK7A1]|uniref:Uncharacterized protein n=1 Tax=Pseudomonas phage phiK7A1 TaxID=2759194 RepID=A0A7H0XFQ6_9CAUD|nr:hypothetical protein phiK7A1_057 [Pseudomonas phage phiK7A1]
MMQQKNTLRLIRLARKMVKVVTQIRAKLESHQAFQANEIQQNDMVWFLRIPQVSL